MTIAIVAGLVVVAAGLGALTVVLRRPRSDGRPRINRVLVPFTGGALDPTVLSSAIRIARAEDATLVPAYLIVIPLDRAEDAEMQSEVAVAMPLLEAVEHAALRAGVAVDARVESGRTAIHALKRLWEAENFDRIVVPAPVFSVKDLTWMLTHAPSQTLILNPGPAGQPNAAAKAPAAGRRRLRPT